MASVSKCSVLVQSGEQSLTFSVQHIFTDTNNEDTPFEFSEENEKKAAEIIAKYPAG